MDDRELRELAGRLIREHNKRKLAEIIGDLIYYGMTSELCQIVVHFKQTPLHDKALAALQSFRDSQRSRFLTMEWYDTLDPELGKLVEEKGYVSDYYSLRMTIFTALKTGRLENYGWLRQPDKRALRFLLEAAESPDATVVQRAKALLSELIGEKTLKLVAAAWEEKGWPFLLDILAKNNYLPKKPLEARVLVALKTENYEVLAAGNRRIAGPLARAAQNDDPIIAERARLTLTRLNKPAQLEELARLVIEQDLPVAGEVLRQRGYLPKANHQKALFYFVTEQWDKYEELDFDQRILRTAYQAGNLATRQHLAAKVRTAGRVDYLNALTRSETRQVSDYTGQEAELLVKILADNGEWARLWQLVFELPLDWSVRAVKRLKLSDWRPAQADEQTLFEHLGHLAGQPLLADPLEAIQAIPPALFVSQIQLGYIITDLALSPVGPQLAVITADNKIVIWNWQTEHIEETIEHFERLGQMAFMPDGRLVLGQESRSRFKTCAVYLYTPGQPASAQTLLTRTGSITALQALDNDRLLVAGRDQRVEVWKVSRPEKLATFYFGEYQNFWVRGIQLDESNPHKLALFLGRGKVFLIDMEKFEQWSTATWMTRQMAETAFLPDGSGILMGTPEGELAVSQFYETTGEFRKRLERLNTYYRPGVAVSGLASLEKLGLVIMAGSDGKIRFVSWPERKTVGWIEAELPLAGIELTAEGHFMLLRSSDTRLEVWDLRTLELRRLFGQALGQGQPLHLAALTALKQSNATLPTDLRNALDYIEAVLHHRFRYALELEETATVQVAEFDIEIEIENKLDH